MLFSDDPALSLKGTPAFSGSCLLRGNGGEIGLGFADYRRPDFGGERRALFDLFNEVGTGVIEMFQKL